MSRKVPCLHNLFKKFKEFDINPEFVECKVDENEELMFESCYQVSDLPGVTACARVNETDEGIKSQLVFKKRGKSAVVNFRDDTITKSFYGNSVDFSPFDHFLALSSYVSDIADVGIVDFVFDNNKRKFGKKSIDFDYMIQDQVARAVREVDPKGTLNLVKTMAEELVTNVDNNI